MLRQRIITALLLAPLALLVILWTSHTITMAVFAVLVVAGAWEWAAFPGFASAAGRALYAALVAAAIATLWMIGPEQAQLDSVLQIAMMWWLVALLWIAFAPGRMNRAIGAIAGFLVLLPAWLALVRLHTINPHLVLFLVLVVVAADVGAYFAGRKFGKHKLAPRVSPAKTWEGVIGGLVEWLFAFPQRLSVTISNGDRLVDMPREELAQAIWRDVCKAGGVSGDMPPWQIVRERRATFEATPEQNAMRPGPVTAYKNLFLAGDWTATGLPATIEGSVRSGDRAADLVLANA